MELDGEEPKVVVCRGLRGATTVTANTSEDILEATSELIRMLIALNGLRPEDIASVLFSTTTDLDATFPALAARGLGWSDVPLMCTHEMEVPASLQRAVRALIHVNTTKSQSEMHHVFLHDARILRPEWGYSDEQIEEILGPFQLRRTVLG